jgi:hypothetical protein
MGAAGQEAEKLTTLFHSIHPRAPEQEQ